MVVVVVMACHPSSAWGEASRPMEWYLAGPLESNQKNKNSLLIDLGTHGHVADSAISTTGAITPNIDIYPWHFTEIHRFYGVKIIRTQGPSLDS
jgi:hypothetical protein